MTIEKCYSGESFAQKHKFNYVGMSSLAKVLFGLILFYFILFYLISSPQADLSSVPFFLSFVTTFRISATFNQN